MIASTSSNTRIYAIGDIHGMADKLDALLVKIKIDSASFSGRKILIALGDYIDRGRKSKQVLETLSTLQWPNWQHIFLKGNHEYGCLTFINTPEKFPDWAHKWEGDTMLQSYGVPYAKTSKAQDLRDKLLYRMPEHHLAFLNNLPIYHIEGDYLFIHAGVRANIPLENQTERDMLFIREPDFTPELSHNLPYRIVYGHRPKPEPLATPDRICIDTGAYKGRPLTAVVLEGEGVRFLHE